MEKINLPDFIITAINLLEKKGFEGYVVGGGVRDKLLGREPDDWDIATNAKPDDIKAIFKKHFDTGIKYGTVTVLIDSFPIEITTYRIDGDYNDRRRPEKVTFANDLNSDLMRRDFTVNAIAYNPSKGLVDVCGGLHDLSHRVIRCVGDADKRFEEDALRVLRALRFAAVLEFEIEPKTYKAICHHAYLLDKISAERISHELTLLLMAKKGIEKLFDTGVGNILLPEVSQCFGVWQNNCEHIYDVGNHTLEVIYNTPKAPILRYCALLHDIGKVQTKAVDKWGFDRFPNHAAVSAVMADNILMRLKLSAKQRKRIVKIIRLHSIIIKPDEVSVRKVVVKAGKEAFVDVIALKKANAMAKSLCCEKQQLEQYKEIERIYYTDIKNNVPFSIKELHIDGNDMQALGFKGDEIGKALKTLLMQVIKQPSLNNRHSLLEMAKSQKKEKKGER
ncbi:MAG: CCA tRNA nucleotidyltransferase [Firmicutes bacterium]|nr:CCA tRNA nucleotidyltransferase [Bacillota bacterium]